jgi:serine/threonine protein kinase
MPGNKFDEWQHTQTEIVAELPFEMESVGNRMLVVKASPRSNTDALIANAFFGPGGGVQPLRITFPKVEAETLEDGMQQWERAFEWPQRVDHASVRLFYQEQEILSLQLTRTFPTAVKKRPEATMHPQRYTPETERGKKRIPAHPSGLPVFKTALETYTALKIKGEGGSGTVYQVQTNDLQIFALKLLSPQKVTSEKRKRFKVELHFCSSGDHTNIVQVLDHGVDTTGGGDSPFYVMPFYEKTLRDLMREKIGPDRALKLFSDMLDGIEAAHLKGVWHRDLKPENVLYDEGSDSLIIADFGIAHFDEDELITVVETGANDRLANFQYAAPEQRVRGGRVDHRADIYALGLILNEMFTGQILQGAGFRRISDVDASYSYLDEIVEALVQQAPEKRPGDIDQIKRTLIAKGAEFISRQKLDTLRQTVVKSTEITDPIVENPIKIESVNIQGSELVISLSQTPPPHWIRAFLHPSSVSFIIGTEPQSWIFRGKQASVHVGHIETSAQLVLNNFKNYVQAANTLYKEFVEQSALRQEKDERAALRERIAQEERRQKILNDLKF